MIASTSRSCRYRISAPIKAPPSGARKMAPMPAPMPVATAMRRSRGFSLSHWPSSEPKPAEICAAGPSRPPDPPAPMVIAEATSLMGGMRARDPSLPVVDGGAGRVGPVALGFGGQGEHDQAREQAAQRHHQRQQPRPLDRSDHGRA